MVSVCLASYHGERYIKEQIDSILSQLGKDDELIISDDGSSDKTISIIQAYDDCRIRLLHNTHHGVNFNFENAIRHAQGDYIFWSDQDDVWFPHKVQTCLGLLQDNDLVVHDCVVVDKSLNTIYPSYFKQFKSRSGYIKNIIKNSYLGACIAFRKEILDYVLPIPSAWPVYIDGWIASLAELNGRICFCDTPLMYYRRHDSNTSPSAGRSHFSTYERICQRCGWLYLTLQRTFKYRYTQPRNRLWKN